MVGTYGNEAQRKICNGCYGEDKDVAIQANALLVKLATLERLANSGGIKKLLTVSGRYHGCRMGEVVRHL